MTKLLFTAMMASLIGVSVQQYQTATTYKTPKTPAYSAPAPKTYEALAYEAPKPKYAPKAYEAPKTQEEPATYEAPKPKYTAHTTYEAPAEEYNLGYETTSYETSYDCPEFSTYVANYDGQGNAACVCWNHYIPDGNGGCQFVCPEGFELDYSDLSKCIRTCPWNHWWDAEADECYECPEYSLFDPAFGYCRCVGGYELNNGVCTKSQACGAYEVYSNGKCKCAEGYVRGATSKKCIKKKATTTPKYTAPKPIQSKYAPY